MFVLRFIYFLPQKRAACFVPPSHFFALRPPRRVPIFRPSAATPCNAFVFRVMARLAKGCSDPRLCPNGDLVLGETGDGGCDERVLYKQ